MAHIQIEFLPHGAAKWENLGRFTAKDEELAELRAVLEQHNDPYEALERLPHGLLWDTLEILRSEGHEARIKFVADH